MSAYVWQIPEWLEAGANVYDFPISVGKSLFTRMLLMFFPHVAINTQLHSPSPVKYYNWLC